MTTATDEAKDFARRIGTSIDASPGPVHAVATVVDRLRGAGFNELDESVAWTASPPERWYVRRDGAVLAGVQSAAPTAGYRIVGAHTDSPTLAIKPRPDTGAANFRQLGVEVYGGALVNSWLDRDLGLSGQLVVQDGDHFETVPVLVDRPVLRVPQLAIHLDGEIREKGLTLDRQRHLAPIWGLGEPTDGDLRRWVADEAGVESSLVVSWDLIVHDLTPATLGGRDEEFLVSARLDDLCSVFCAVEALVDRIEQPTPLDHHPIVCFFDHEEVGSVSASGAAGELLAGVLERVAGAGGTSRDAHRAALARSLCVSADMAHATHPNYADRHEPDHQIALNAGPVIKTNANQRYATSSVGVAHVIQACASAGVPHQHFVSRSDLPCGSTIGPVTAERLGITTVDVGIAQLAMHSSRETAGSEDPIMLTHMLRNFF